MAYRKRIDWQAVAQTRLTKLRASELRMEQLRSDIYYEVHRELANMLHARCISNSENMAREIAHAVSSRLTT